MSFNNIEKTERLEKNKNFASRLSRTFVHLRVHRISAPRDSAREKRSARRRRKPSRRWRRQGGEGSYI